MLVSLLAMDVNLKFRCTSVGQFGIHRTLDGYWIATSTQPSQARYKMSANTDHLHNCYFPDEILNNLQMLESMLKN